MAFAGVVFALAFVAQNRTFRESAASCVPLISAANRKSKNADLIFLSKCGRTEGPKCPGKRQSVAGAAGFLSQVCARQEFGSAELRISKGPAFVF